MFDHIQQIFGLAAHSAGNAKHELHMQRRVGDDSLFHELCHIIDHTRFIDFHFGNHAIVLEGLRQPDNVPGMVDEDVITEVQRPGIQGCHVRFEAERRQSFCEVFAHGPSGAELDDHVGDNRLYRFLSRFKPLDALAGATIVLSHMQMHHSGAGREAGLCFLGLLLWGYRQIGLVLAGGLSSGYGCRQDHWFHYLSFTLSIYYQSSNQLSNKRTRLSRLIWFPRIRTASWANLSSLSLTKKRSVPTLPSSFSASSGFR